MSNEKQKSDDREMPFANPMKLFSDMYNETLKQTAEQWEETARNPMFLAAMANNVEQTMQMQKQMQEMVNISLQALNLPTKDDFLLLIEKISQISSSISEINAKLDNLVKESKSSDRKTQTKGGWTKI